MSDFDASDYERPSKSFHSAPITGNVEFWKTELHHAEAEVASLRAQLQETQRQLILAREERDTAGAEREGAELKLAMLRRELAGTEDMLRYERDCLKKLDAQLCNALDTIIALKKPPSPQASSSSDKLRLIRDLITTVVPE